MTDRIYKGIKPTRRLLQVSQGELAQRLGIVATHLSSVELGSRGGSRGLYEDICEVLGLPFAVIALESLQLTDIPTKDMKEFLAIKEQLYRLLGVTRVVKEKMDAEEARKLAERLWEGKQSKKISELVENTL